MSADNLLSSTSGAQALNIFGTALIAFIITVLIKYWTKAHLFRLDSTANKTERRAAHFDCLRVGVDLSLLGLGTYLAASLIVLEKKMAGAIAVLSEWNGTIILIQIVLLIAAGVITTLTDSPAKAFKKGIILPFVLGWISICVSAMFFFHIISHG